MRELIISWSSDDYQALQFEHEQYLREETADKEIRGSKGAVYFEGPKYGYGFYKSNSSDHYGTAAFMVFDKGTIGYYRVYVRDDDAKPHMVSTGHEISTQFILKRKN